MARSSPCEPSPPSPTRDTLELARRGFSAKSEPMVCVGCIVTGVTFAATWGLGRAAQFVATTRQRRAMDRVDALHSVPPTSRPRV